MSALVYNSFQDLKLSALGLGAMRLPVVKGDDSQIDVEASQQMVDYAMASTFSILPGVIMAEIRKLYWANF